MIFNSLARLSLYWSWVVSQGGRGAVVDFCLLLLRCVRYHLHKQMALEEPVSKELCWLCMWLKSQYRNLSSTITLQMLPFTHHQFPPSRKASLIIAANIGKGHHNMCVS